MENQQNVSFEMFIASLSIYGTDYFICVTCVWVEYVLNSVIY